MNLQLEGKRALVTGSTAGIGFAIAEALANEGASVIVNGRTQKRVDEAVAKLKGNVEGVAADLETAAGAEIAARKYPDVDILINNLGIFEPKPFEQISDDDWRRFFEVNVLSGVRLSRQYLPGMKQRNWGRIIFISSESAVQIPAEMIHYGMTKTAQLAVARGLAESLVGTNVTVNSVLPGPTASEGVSGFVAQLAAASGKSAADVEREFFNSARPSSILRRFTAPAEIASLITYLCGAQASATTGAALRADGGVIRAIV
jgi:NAD(P)-dependent dehydrogenase (short-subunit alcohol dehydrogenase family)